LNSTMSEARSEAAAAIGSVRDLVAELSRGVVKDLE
jgi:hypothetical protein